MVDSYSYYYSGYFLVIISFIVVTLAQVILRITYARYKKKGTEKGLTGKEVAEKILHENGLDNVKVVEIQGELTDNYYDAKKTVSLSTDIYNGESIAAVSVAAHECGHAVQYKVGYGPIKLRNKLVPIVNLGNTIGYIVMVIGLAASSLGLFWLGIILLSLALVFQLVTLPCEFDASRRANKMLLEMGLVSKKEQKGTKTMLRAAAFTYVAGLFSSIMQILRLILIFSNRRSRR